MVRPLLSCLVLSIRSSSHSGLLCMLEPFQHIQVAFACSWLDAEVNYETRNLTPWNQERALLFFNTTLVLCQVLKPDRKCSTFASRRECRVSILKHAPWRQFMAWLNYAQNSKAH